MREGGQILQQNLQNMHKNNFFSFFFLQHIVADLSELAKEITMDGKTKSLFPCIKALKGLGGEDYLELTCTVDAIYRKALEKAKISFDLYVNCDLNGNKHPSKLFRDDDEDIELMSRGDFQIRGETIVDFQDTNLPDNDKYIGFSVKVEFGKAKLMKHAKLVFVLAIGKCKN